MKKRGDAVYVPFDKELDKIVGRLSPEDRQAFIYGIWTDRRRTADKRVGTIREEKEVLRKAIEFQYRAIRGKNLHLSHSQICAMVGKKFPAKRFGTLSGRTVARYIPNPKGRKKP